MPKKTKSTELVTTSPAVVTKRVTLRSLAIAVKSDLCELDGTMRQSVDVIIRIGGRLHEARALAKHGQWLIWLKESIGMSNEYARLYMRAYDQREKLLAADEPIDSLRKALQILGIRKTPGSLEANNPATEDPSDTVVEPIKVEITSVREVERAPDPNEDDADQSSGPVALLTTTAAPSPLTQVSERVETDVVDAAAPVDEPEYACITGAFALIAEWQDAVLSAIQTGAYPDADLPMLVASIDQVLPILHSFKAAASQRIEPKPDAVSMPPRRSLREQLMAAGKLTIPPASAAP